MSKKEIIETRIKEIVKSNNKHLRAYLRGDARAIERIEVNSITMRKFLAIS